jgi:hypothetical protein
MRAGSRCTSRRSPPSSFRRWSTPLPKASSRETAAAAPLRTAVSHSIAPALAIQESRWTRACGRRDCITARSQTTYLIWSRLFSLESDRAKVRGRSHETAGRCRVVPSRPWLPDCALRRGIAPAATKAATSIVWPRCDATEEEA